MNPTHEISDRPAGVRNGAALWRELRDIGFRGSLRVVAEWTIRRRRADQVNIEGLTRVPSARTVARLMTMARDTLSRTQTVTVAVAAIKAAIPTLVQPREIVDAFHTLSRRKQEAALDSWLETAATSLLASFARGLARDHHAVRAAISSAWSNARAEGPDQQTQAGQTSYVRLRQSRPPPGSRHCGGAMTVTKTASEPLLDAD